MSIRSTRRAFTTAVAVILALVFAGSAFAALCVWRKPDEDIKKYFPGGDTYKTEVTKPSKAQKAAIEKRLGTKLDSDEQEFKFYRIIDKKKRVGTIMTHLGKGEYGAIEIVMAIDIDAKVKGVGIQRDREKKRAELRGDKFLDQFKGKTVKDPIKLDKDIKPVEGAKKSSETVAFSVRKLLIVNDEIG